VEAERYAARRRRAPVTETDDLALWADAPMQAPAPTHEVSVRAHLRTVPGEAPASGAERRDAILAAHETDDVKRVALDYVRGKLAALYHERVLASRWTGEVPYVTADDADRLLTEWAQYPAELRAQGNSWRGSIFKPGAWQKAGPDVPSTRDRMHATPIACWRYVGAAS
jgi:hypothetical protein